MNYVTPHVPRKMRRAVHPGRRHRDRSSKVISCKLEIGFTYSLLVVWSFSVLHMILDDALMNVDVFPNPSAAYLRDHLVSMCREGEERRGGCANELIDNSQHYRKHRSRRLDGFIGIGGEDNLGSRGMRGSNQDKRLRSEIDFWKLSYR